MLGLNSANLLFSWGNNSYGELGLGNRTARSSPVQIGTSSWTAIAQGENFSAAIRTNNLLYVWGRNSYGQLAQSNTINRSSPVQVGISSWSALASMSQTRTMAALDSTKKLFVWGYNPSSGGESLRITGVAGNRSSPIQIGSANWSNISIGTSHLAGLRS